MWEQLPKEIKVLVVLFALALVFGSGVLTSQLLLVKQAENELLELPAADASEDENQVAAVETKKEERSQLVVHVSGAVVNPGVYTLPEGSRVNDAVLLAVPSAEADLNRLNLAAPLKDGQKITVPKEGEPLNLETAPLSETASGQAKAKVNINTAGLAELDALPGIGPATAQKIIDYRTQHGEFKSVDELDNVPGIGPKKLEELKGLVTVN